MDAIKRHPFFAAWIALCLVLGVGGFFWMHHLRQKSRHELVSLARKIQLKDQLLQQVRLPGPENVPSSTDEHVVAAATAVAGMIPRKPLDGFIEIAEVAEKLRRAAASDEVALHPEESFGFATYAHEGPGESQLAVVHHQLGLTQLLVGKLFAARPDKLLAVRREHPNASRREGPQEATADFFQLDPRTDLRVAGLIEGQAMRLEFTGQTRVLRTYLNSLAAAPEALLVRSVEAEPLQNGGSKFSVVVELAEPTASSGIVGMTASATPQALWTTSPSSAPGVDQGYDLFTPTGVNRSPSPTAVKIVAADEFELVAVKREPFRLQLMGCFGVPGNYIATFVSQRSPETLRAREGHRFESLGLVLKNIAMKKVGLKSHDGQPAGYEMTPSASLWDEQKQEMITLLGRERLLTDKPLAVLRFGASTAQPQEFRMGDAFKDGSASYHIERIQLYPAEVVIVRQRPGESLPERRVLHPADHPAPVPGADLAVTGSHK